MSKYMSVYMWLTGNGMRENSHLLVALCWSKTCQRLFDQRSLMRGKMLALAINVLLFSHESVIFTALVPRTVYPHKVLNDFYILITEELVSCFIK